MHSADHAADEEPKTSEKTESGELVRLLLESTGEGIYGIDMDGCCTFANPACVRLLVFDDTDEL